MFKSLIEFVLKEWRRQHVVNKPEKGADMHPGVANSINSVSRNYILKYNYLLQGYLEDKYFPK